MQAPRRMWPVGLALATLAVVTVVVALVSEIFVESVQEAAIAFGMTPAFVGFVVALVGGAAEMASAFSGARRTGSIWAWELRSGARHKSRSLSRRCSSCDCDARSDANGPAVLARGGRDDPHRDVQAASS